MPMLRLSASLIMIFAPLAVTVPKLLVAFERVTFPEVVKLATPLATIFVPGD